MNIAMPVYLLIASAKIILPTFYADIFSTSAQLAIKSIMPFFSIGG